MTKTNKPRLLSMIALCLLTISCFVIESKLDTSVSSHTLEANDEYKVIWDISGINGHNMVGAPGRIIIHGWETGDIATFRLIALDSITGETIWTTAKFKTSGGRIITHDGFLYHGTNGTAKVKAYDIKTGEILWDTRLPWAHSVDMISYAENKIFAHTNDLEFFVLNEKGDILENFNETFRIFMQTENVLYMDDVLGIQAIDNTSREKKWELELGAQYSIPIFDNGTIFIRTLSKGGEILSINQSTGEINWKVSQDVLSNMYVAGERIYFLGSSEHLVSLDRHSGEEISRVLFSPSLNVNQQNGGYFVTGDTTNNVLAISFGDNSQIIGLQIENP